MATFRERVYLALKRAAFLRKLIPKPVKDALLARFLGARQERVPYDPARYPQGINLFGFLSASLGLGQGARLYARALDASRIPHALLDVRLSPGAPLADPESSDIYAGAPVYGINIVHVNPDMLPLLYRLTPKAHWDGRYQIGVWLWELEQLPPAWREWLDAFDEFWAPSRFVADALQRAVKKPVHIVPYGIGAPIDPGLDRKAFGLPEDVFLTLCMFDIHSFASRKNPAAAVSAFLEAFGPADETARLVLKVHNASPQDLLRLEALTGGMQNALVINREMGRLEVNSLIRCCDALISLHRSEGFGLVLAEAMYLGVPVVATHWSGNTDFMNGKNACPVDYTLVPTAGAYLYGQQHQRWAEPDVSMAARHLRRLYEDGDYRASVAGAGMESIRRDFSMERCAEAMEARYAAIIHKEPPV